MSVEEDPKIMRAKLESAYSDTTGNTKRLLWDSVRSKTFTGKRETMIDHLPTLEMFSGQLNACNVPKDLQLSILFDSVAANPEYKSVVDTLRVSSDSLQNWKEMSKRLISTYAVNRRTTKNSKDSEASENRLAKTNVVGAQQKIRKPRRKSCSYFHLVGLVAETCWKKS